MRCESVGTLQAARSSGPPVLLFSVSSPPFFRKTLATHVTEDQVTSLILIFNLITGQAKSGGYWSTDSRSSLPDLSLSRHIAGPCHQPLCSFAAGVIPPNLQYLLALSSYFLYCFDHDGPVNLPVKDGVIHPRNNKFSLRSLERPSILFAA